MVEFHQEFISVIQDVFLVFCSHCDRVLHASIEFRNECEPLALGILHENNREIHCLQVSVMIK